MKIKFHFGKLNTNHHIYPGFKTIHGPRFKFLKLKDVHLPSTGYRLYYYFPSGACWNVDVYFDRRDRWWAR
jgi:predicted RNA-binding protein associated with RNAse of E/G family